MVPQCLRTDRWTFMPLLGKKHEPSWNNNGLKLISMAYSLLYLTVLTPGGLALLAFLTGQGVSAEKLSFFVAAGVVAGGGNNLSMKYNKICNTD